MTHQEFEKLQEQFFDDLRKLGAEKGREYSNQENRLANFKEEGREMGVSPLKVCHIFFNKHYRAICSYIREGREFSEEGIYGRFKDAVLYLILMYALVVDNSKTGLNQALPKINNNFWIESNIGPVCFICGCNIIKGDWYDRSLSGRYFHLSHDNTQEETSQGPSAGSTSRNS